MRADCCEWDFGTRYTAALKTIGRDRSVGICAEREFARRAGWWARALGGLPFCGLMVNFEIPWNPVR